MMININDPSQIADIAHKDLGRIGALIQAEPKPPPLKAATVFTYSLCVKQGFDTFKKQYREMEQALRDWRIKHARARVYLQWNMRADDWGDTIMLQVCEFFGDSPLPEPPKVIQLPLDSPTVYLAGPITGCSFEGCTDWREQAIKQLAPWGIRGLSPMRAKDYLKNEKQITGSYEDKVMSCARGITTRDRFDCMRCDVLLVNFLGAKKVSIGTVMEIAWADSQRIPIICALTDDSVHDHPMIKECVGFRVAMLDEAIECAIKILGLSSKL